MRSILKPLLLILFLFVFTCYGQALKKEYGDLENARFILINTTYTFPNSPVGFGKRQEFPKNPYRSPIVFKEEKNTAWLLIKMPHSGIFTFEITPKKSTDDYDWMVYQYTKNLARDIAKDIARPIRSNISRNDTETGGKTGLKEGFKNAYANAGPGKSFSKPLEVKKGDTLAIVVDNIYPKGGGFNFTSNLTLSYRLDAVIKGRILSNDKKPLAGQLICEDDSTGMVISQVTANANGEYAISVPTERDLNLTAKHSGYIFKTEDVYLKFTNNKLDFYLDPVLDGKKLVLFNIHFTPDKDLILFNAQPDLNRLVAFLKEYPQYDARIIGHTNNNPFADTRYLQRLSFQRALAVKKHLLANGIDENRISCMGMGGKSPVVNSKDQKEGMKNLRVEVILGLKEE